jgi:hypothetical protein
VDPDSHAELSIGKNVLLDLIGDSHLVVGHTTTRETRLTLTRGTVLGKVETGGPRGVWTIETPGAVCTIRGTEFAILHGAEDGTHLGVFKGAVEFAPAESAMGISSPVMVEANQEGAVQRNKPLKALTAFSPLIRALLPSVKSFQKRFHEVSDVWVPMTVEYRKQLRQKYIAPVKKSVSHPHTVAPARRRKH